MMSDGHKSVDDVWDAIEKERVALLTTNHGGKLETRPMAPHVDRDAGVIRFITKLDSAKTGDIGSSSEVNVGYANPSRNTYLSVAGTATISQDRAKLHELWSTWAEAWLPQGPDAPDVGLITVEPETAVLWDSTSSRIVSAVEHIRAALTGGRPNVGTMERVDLS